MEISGVSLSDSLDLGSNVLNSWEPEPLVPKVDLAVKGHLLNNKIITSKGGKYIIVDGVECLNFGTHNYLGLADMHRLERASIEAAEKYGVGSCGPRAFYGTMDVHLQLEEEISNFLGVQETALYSFGFAAIASAIPAYAKPKDVVFVDEQVNFAIQQGLIASKSTVIVFRHNDTRHLETLLEDFMADQIRETGKTSKVRTFLIVEGVYAKTGKICPLVELIDLKKKYKVRLFIDESRSFGVLGRDGKGVTQHLNVDIQDVDLVMASLENAFCAYGGFCAGSSYVVDHQRLAGAGYCFSASLPPLQTRVALESLNMIREYPAIVTDAQNVYVYAHKALTNLSRLENISDSLSPIKILTVKACCDDLKEANMEELLTRICNKMLDEEQMALTVARYIEEAELSKPPVSIRLVIGGSLDSTLVDRLVSSLERISKALIP